ncbi:MAG: zinc ribbon domain-containing protein [Clostridia bacterium]|nr:zinc ribbon domain-containing protein [Clostridia bacterium]MDE7215284.1 zinc ribbon domain-containing protein [Clostridia bacterium]
MNCFNCGTQNPEEAKFCRHCGARLDGKTVCPDCKTENVADSNFCICCGRNLSKTVSVENTENVKPVAEKNYAEKTLNWKSVVSTLGGIFSMLGLLFSILFTFFIGLKIKGPTSIVESINTMGMPKNIDIFYYFGDAYKNITSIDLALPDFTKTSLYFPVILATIVFAALLLAMVIMTILTLVKYYLYVTRKSDKDHSAMVIATYFLYLFGVLMFFVFNNSLFSLQQNTATYSVSCEINDLTATGIALSTIFVCASVGCKIAINAKGIMSGVYNTVFTAISLILVCVSIYLTIMPHVAYNYDAENIYARTNFFSAISLLGDSYFTKTITTSGGIAALLPAKSTLTVPNAESALLIVPAILQILVIVLLLIIAAGYLLNFAKNKKYSNASLSLVSTLATTFLLIFTVISSMSFWSYLLGEKYEMGSVKFTYVIAMLILSIVQLTIAMIHRSFNKIESKAMEKQEDQII